MIEATIFGTAKVLMVVYTVMLNTPAQPVFQRSEVVSFVHCKNMQEMAFMFYPIKGNPAKFKEYTIVLCDRFA